MSGSVRHRSGARLLVVLAALVLAALPLELRLRDHALPALDLAKASAKNGDKSGGSDNSGSGGSDKSGSDDSGSDKSASDNSGSGGSDKSGSDDSGSDKSGSDKSASGKSGSDDSDESGESDSSGPGSGGDASDDDNGGSGTSGGSKTSGSSSGQSGGRNGQRSIGEFLGLLKKKGEIARVMRTQGGVVVRYSDGWREQVVGGSYQLIDGKDRIVVKRPASRSDLQRLLAAAP